MAWEMLSWAKLASGEPARSRMSAERDFFAAQRATEPTAVRPVTSRRLCPEGFECWFWDGVEDNGGACMALDLSATGGSNAGACLATPSTQEGCWCDQTDACDGSCECDADCSGAVLALPAVVPPPWSGFCRSFGFHGVFTCNFTDFSCRFVAALRSI